MKRRSFLKLFGLAPAIPALAKLPELTAPPVTVSPPAAEGSYLYAAFEPVSGFQKIGTYVGNSIDPPFLYCGFKPTKILVKRRDEPSGWEVFET